jgi:DNA-binding transcriptional MocR family regulator
VIGLPNDGYFPYDTLEAQVALPDRWSPSTDPDKAENKAVKKGDPSNVVHPESHLVVPHTISNAKDLTRKIDLASALQYGTAQGYPPLWGFLKEFTTKYLHPTIPYKDGADIILTCGSTDGFSKTLQCFSNEWAEGRDPVGKRPAMLVEEHVYMQPVQAARPRGMNIVPVKIDHQGMRAEGVGALRDVLENWDYGRGKRPHLLYTVT